MTRSRPLPLIVLAVAGFGIAFVLEAVLAQRGLPIVVLPLSLGVALVLIAAVLIALAWPVRAAAKGERHVDPFYATRIVVLAKSSALAGALLAGVAAGTVTYLLSRAVVTGGPTVTGVATLVAAVVLLIAALVAEHWCTLPPRDDDPDPAAAPSAP